MSTLAWLAGARGFVLLQALYLLSQLLGREELRRWPLALVHAAAVAAAAWSPVRTAWPLAVLAALQCSLTFPRTANHAFLAAVAAVLFAAARAEERDQRWQVLSLPVVALFWSGVQKLAHGLWFRGEALAALLVMREDVALTLSPWLADARAADLGALDITVVGAGPFRLWGGWVWLCNAVWLIELAVPLLFVVRSLRAHAWWLVIALCGALQWVAHEWEFALLVTHLALVGAPATAQRWGRVLVALGLLALALLRSGALPSAVGWWP